MRVACRILALCLTRMPASVQAALKAAAPQQQRQPGAAAAAAGGLGVHTPPAISLRSFGAVQQ